MDDFSLFFFFLPSDFFFQFPSELFRLEVIMKVYIPNGADEGKHHAKDSDHGIVNHSNRFQENCYKNQDNPCHQNSYTG